MKKQLYKTLKNIQMQTPLRKHMFYRYEYFFNPVELWYLCSCLEQTAEVPGNLLELGCAYGATTVFVNKHREWLVRGGKFPAEKVYHCLDTFAGFTEQDMDFEAKSRGKVGERGEGWYAKYQINDQRWFEAMLEYNELSNIKVITADANTYDYSQLGKLSFALLDVDLYLPMKSALENSYPLLQAGGIIVVDDTKPDQPYDGAYQAYQEFREALGLPEEIQFGKFGILRK